MSSHEEIHQLQLFPGSSVTIALFRDVKNVPELKTAVSEGKIDATLLSPKLVSSASSNCQSMEMTNSS